MTPDFLIEANNINLRLGGRDILQSVDLTLHAGKLVTLIGPNGAGKTSLVRVVLGLLKPQQGTLRRAPGLRIGYVPQKLVVEPTLPLTVRRFLQLAPGQRRAPVKSWLDDVGIGHLQDQQINGLSGGEMQRVLLARAMSHRPHLLVLDEPAQGVDINGQVELYEIINRLREQYGCGVLMVSHDLHLVMATTDEVICLNQHICCQGKPEHVSTDPAYLALFGPQQARTLAVYTHHHNHEHDIDGSVVGGNSCTHSTADHAHKEPDHG